MNQDGCEIKKFASTQLLQIQKNKLLELPEHLERYCNVLPVFGFNSAKYDLNLLRLYLLPILNNEGDTEPTVIKKANCQENEFILFKFGVFQLLDIINVLCGATRLDSIWEASKTSERKGYFPYEWFDYDKRQNTKLPPYVAFYSKLRNCNTLETEYIDYVNLLKNVLTTEQAVVKLKLSKPPPYQDWELSKTATHMEAGSNELNKRFLHWCNKKILCQL